MNYCYLMSISLLITRVTFFSLAHHDCPDNPFHGCHYPHKLFYPDSYAEVTHLSLFETYNLLLRTVKIDVIFFQFLFFQFHFSKFPGEVDA